MAAAMVSLPRTSRLATTVLEYGERFFAWTLFPRSVSSVSPSLCPLCLHGMFDVASQAKRALREVARVRLCADIDSLLRAVSVVMAADYNGEDGDDPAEPFGDEIDGGALPDGCTSNTLSEVTACTFTVGEIYPDAHVQHSVSVCFKHH